MRLLLFLNLQQVQTTDSFKKKPLKLTSIDEISKPQINEISDFIYDKTTE